MSARAWRPVSSFGIIALVIIYRIVQRGVEGLALLPLSTVCGTA